MKRITTVVAAMKSFFLGKSGSKKTREKQMAPLRPPYAIINWSLLVTVFTCNLFTKKVNTRTPIKQERRWEIIKQEENLPNIHNGRKELKVSGYYTVNKLHIRRNRAGKILVTY